MSTVTRPPIQPEIEHPDSDGEPLSDHDLQDKWIVTIKEGLEAQYDAELNVYIAADLLWYPVEGNPRIRGAPDTFVVLGRPKGIRGSYMQWLEGGLAPHVVFEVMSPGNRRGEMEQKFEYYESYGVEEYYVYNPFNGAMDGWLRRGDHLQKIANMKGFVSPRLGIRFGPGPGNDNLKIIRRDGREFITSLEKERRLIRSEERAKAAKERDKAAKERAVVVSRRDGGAPSDLRRARVGTALPYQQEPPARKTERSAEE